METHEHGPGCGCAAAAHVKIREPAHKCDPYCYHQSDKYKKRQARKKARVLHETMWNTKLNRPRPPYPKDPVVPLHLIGVLPLVADEGGRVPSNLQISEAKKGYNNMRNKRRRRRP